MLLGLCEFIFVKWEGNICILDKEPYRTFCILGVLLELSLLLNEQIVAVAWGVFHQLWLVSQRWLFLGRKDLATTYIWIRL